MAFKAKGRVGRKPGVPNKATANAREAIAALVDRNVPRMEAWLDAIAEDQGPLAAWKCMADVIEYHIPKLARSEISANVNVTRSASELSDDELAAIVARGEGNAPEK